jgi:hypothetical protein
VRDLFGHFELWMFARWIVAYDYHEPETFSFHRRPHSSQVCGRVVCRVYDLGISSAEEHQCYHQASARVSLKTSAPS